jgi:hypothetical protein
MLDQQLTDIQRTLDDLFANKLIPFRLVARAITEDYLGEVTVHFHDSRLRSVTVSALGGDSLAPQVRAAVLQRLGRKQELSANASVRN